MTTELPGWVVVITSVLPERVVVYVVSSPVLVVQEYVGDTVGDTVGAVVSTQSSSSSSSLEDDAEALGPKDEELEEEVITRPLEVGRKLVIGVVGTLDGTLVSTQSSSSSSSLEDGPKDDDGLIEDGTEVMLPDGRKLADGKEDVKEMLPILDPEGKVGIAREGTEVSIQSSSSSSSLEDGPKDEDGLIEDPDGTVVMLPDGRKLADGRADVMETLPIPDSPEVGKVGIPREGTEVSMQSSSSSSSDAEKLGMALEPLPLVMLPLVIFPLVALPLVTLPLLPLVALPLVMLPLGEAEERVGNNGFPEDRVVLAGAPDEMLNVDCGPTSVSMQSSSSSSSEAEEDGIAELEEPETEEPDELSPKRPNNPALSLELEACARLELELGNKFKLLDGEALLELLEELEELGKLELDKLELDAVLLEVEFPATASAAAKVGSAADGARDCAWVP